MSAATDFFGDPIRPSLPLRWWLLECAHYGEGRLHRLGGAAMNKKTAGTILLALGVALAIIGVGAAFLAIWAHGADLPTRLSGTAFLGVIVGAIVAGIGGVLRE